MMGIRKQFSLTIGVLAMAIASPLMAIELDTGASTSTFLAMADSDCFWDADGRVWDESNDMMVQLPDHAKHGAAAWGAAKEEHGLETACDAANDIHDRYIKARYE